jgi:hypothetical protein
MSSYPNGHLGSMDDGWDEVDPTPVVVLPEGRYLAHLVKIISFERPGSPPKVSLVFGVASGKARGAETRYFLSFGDRARAKGILALLGLGDVRPSDLLAFSEFDRLPAVFVTTVRRTVGDRIYSNVALIERARVAGGDVSPPGPSGEAA